MLSSYQIIHAKAQRGNARTGDGLNFLSIMINSNNMGDINSYLEKLGDALEQRSIDIESSEIPKVKELLKNFQRAINLIYNILIRKGYITEDPYKDDSRTNTLSVPEDKPIPENAMRDILGQRLAALDNQFDYLVNFFQFSLLNLNQDNIKLIMGLVRFVDWIHLSADSPSKTTQGVERAVSSIKHTGNDAMGVGVLNETLLTLERESNNISNCLRQVNDYNRERYKYLLRLKVTRGLSESEAQIPTIKKKFAAECPGEHFYQELAEEVIAEDYSPQSESLHEAVLKKLSPPPQTSRQKIKQAVNYKGLLIEALNAVGSANSTFAEVLQKLQSNKELMSSKRKGFWNAIIKFFSKLTNSEEEPTFYDIEYFDSIKGTRSKDHLNFDNFCSELERKTRILASITFHGPAAAKLEAMQEPMLIELLQKNIKDLAGFHKTLKALDEFFKENTDRADRSKVKGIKPELSAIKNAESRANKKLLDYYTAKESSEQLKKLGVEES